MATILLVEDEPALAQIIVEALEKNGHRVLNAGNGKAALQLCEQHRPGLIILDWALFALDGVVRLHALRRASHSPILMLIPQGVVSNSLVSGLLSLEYSADDFLAKPFKQDDLLARVQMLLQRVERVQQIISADREERLPLLEYKNLVLDRVQRQVTANGEPVELTSIEFDLLALLMSYPGRTFSSAYLLETVCNGASIRNEHTIDAIMHHLSKKLGNTGIIETVLGSGYRLKPAHQGHF